MNSSALNPPASEGRIPGLDLLRFLCMLMVIVLHVLGQGGILNGAAPGSANYYLAWALECLCFCAVDCYALLSGFLSAHRSRPGYSRLLLLWLEVVLYSVLYACVFRIISHEYAGKRELLSALFPVMRRQYWYFTAFFALSFLAPLINAGVQRLERRIAALMAGLLIAVFSVLPTLFCTDPFNMRSGYSALWVVILYILGALLNRGELQRRTAPGCLLVVFLLSTLLTFLLKVVFPVSIPRIGTLSAMNYTSPTVLFSAISLLFLLFHLRVRGEKRRRMLLRLSAASFGVYILHTNPLVWTYWFYPGVLKGFAHVSVWVFPLLVIGSSALIYLLCFIIDSARALAFQKLGLQTALERCEQRLLKLPDSEESSERKEPS